MFTDQPPLRLDGGTATALQRAGLPVVAPWWATSALLSEERRRVLRSVHASYLTAGAQVLTANTFRCNLRALRTVTLDGAGPSWLVQTAIGVAMAARNDVGATRALIAGSMAPAEDCYRPDLVPSDAELRAEHRWLANELVSAGVDLVLIETMNTRREASIALEEVLAVGGRAWVSFVCTAGARLLSGESAPRAARAVEAEGAEVVLVNCTGMADTEACLGPVRDACQGPIGAYPNVENRGATDLGADAGQPPTALSPDEFAAALERWHHELGADVLGGCCGTSPAYIAAITDRFQSRGREPTRVDVTRPARA